MDDDSIRLRVGCELIEIRIEILDHLRADGVGALTSLAPIGQGLQRVDPASHAPLGVEV